MKEHIRVQQTLAPRRDAHRRPALGRPLHELGRASRRLVPRRSRRRRATEGGVGRPPRGPHRRQWPGADDRAAQRRRRSRDVHDRARDVERSRAAARAPAVVPGVPRPVLRGVHRRGRQARGRRADAVVHRRRRLDRVLRVARRSGGVRRDQEALRRGLRDRVEEPRRGRENDRRRGDGDVRQPGRRRARVAADPPGVSSQTRGHADPAEDLARIPARASRSARTRTRTSSAGRSTSRRSCRRSPRATRSR